MKANIYDSFTQLREIIIGDIDVSWASIADKEHRQKIEHILGKTKEDLNNLSTLLTNIGINVYRPNIYNLSSIHTPYFNVNYTRLPLSPSDLFLILGNDIIEVSLYDRQRYFEKLNFRKVFLDYYNKGNRFLSMPQPILSDDTFNGDSLNNNEILMDASNVLQVGKDVFVTVTTTGNLLGFNWLKQHYPEYNFHMVDYINGHIDCHWAVLRPGLVICNSAQKLHSKFDNWDKITMTNQDNNQTLLDSNFQDDDWDNTNIGICSLVINENTILINSELKDFYKPFIKQLEAHKIDIVFSEITYSGFFNQGLTCLCVETVREGKLEDYF